MITDGHKAYLEAVRPRSAVTVDYAMLVTMYGAVLESANGRYSQADCTGIKKTKIEGYGGACG